MFEYFRGLLTEIEPAYVVVDCQGVGYLLHMANPYRLANHHQQEVTVYAYQHMGQDKPVLYGFPSKDEKEFFLRLIKVSGIGPKSALAILAHDNHDGFIQAIENENVKYLTQFPGIGKKTAGQLILDLKGKLTDLLQGTVVSDLSLFDRASNEELAEALQALEALGYTQKERDRVQKELEKEEPMTTDAYLRLGLSLLTSK